MPNIPVTLSKEGYDTSGLERSYSRVTATPDMFGAQIGKALEGLGTGIGQASHALSQYLEEGKTQKRAEDLAVLRATTNITRPALEVEQTAPPDGAGTAQRTYDAQKKVIDDKAATIQDPKLRSQFVREMYTQLPQWTTRAVGFEFKRNADNSKDQVDIALNTIDNTLRVNPNHYDQAVKDSDALIDTRTQIPTATREDMKRLRRQSLANTRFEGMLTATRDKNGLLAVEAELLGGRPLRPGGTAQVGNIATEGALARDEKGNPIPLKSMVVDVDGVSTVLPAIGPDGKPISEEEAIKRHRETNDHFGKFNTAAQAKAYSNELDEHQKSLAGNRWHKELNPQHYEQLLSKINEGKKTAQTAADNNAKLALDTIEGRIIDPKTGEIDPKEFKFVYDAVQESGNPAHLRKLFELEQHQRWKKNLYGQPTSQMRNQENVLRGGLGSVFPNAHPEIVNIATETNKWFKDVSVPYLVGTMYREYGKNIPAPRAVGLPAFQPQPTPGMSPQLKGAVDPRVYDALTVAGQTFGQPIQVNSGYRSQERQNQIIFRGGGPRQSVASHSYHTERTAVDINTVGMDAPTRARLVNSLIEVGFTGFGEYGTHIHADMRANVPSSYRAGFGGWTNLSPEVQAVMEQRGFRAGASAAQINREGPGSKAMVAGEPPPIDYTQGTSITQGGAPTSQARGLFQVIPGTWEYMTNPALEKNSNTLRIIKEATKDANNPNGIDLAGMTPAQRWEYSKNPRVSALVGAAYATENRAALSAGLKRDPSTINDAELYMAHLMGAGGATAFLRAYTSTPDVAATAVLAKKDTDANKPVFYADRGRGPPLTVREVHDRITQSILQAPSRLQHQQSVTVGKIADAAEKEVKRNPVGHSQTPLGGSNVVVPLTAPGGYEARGTLYANNAAKLEIPREDNKPFDVDTELAGLVKQWKDGDDTQRMAMLRDFARMDKTGPGAFDAAMKQMELKDSAYDVAGQLTGTNMPTATAVVAGQNRIDKDPSAIKVLGREGDSTSEFNKNVQHALSSMDPKSRDAIIKAANAHYVNTAFTKGLPFDKLDPKEYAKSIQAVVGGDIDNPRIAVVDGYQVVLPRDVPAPDFAIVSNNLTNQDLIRYSVGPDGQPIGMLPRYANGDVPTPADIRAYAQFKYVGNDTYRITMQSDYKDLIVPSGRAGGFGPYLIRLNKEAVDEVKSRPNLVREPPGWQGQGGAQPTLSGPAIDPALLRPTAPAGPPATPVVPSTPPPSLPPGMP